MDALSSPCLNSGLWSRQGQLAAPFSGSRTGNGSLRSLSTPVVVARARRRAWGSCFRNSGSGVGISLYQGALLGTRLRILPFQLQSAKGRNVIAAAASGSTGGKKSTGTKSGTGTKVKKKKKVKVEEEVVVKEGPTERKVQKTVTIERQGPPAVKQKQLTEDGFPLVKDRIAYSDLLAENGSKVRTIYHRRQQAIMPFNAVTNELVDRLGPKAEEDQTPIRVLVELEPDERIARTTLPPARNKAFWKQFAECGLQNKLKETLDPTAELRATAVDLSKAADIAAEREAEQKDDTVTWPIAVVMLIVIYGFIAKAKRDQEDFEERQRLQKAKDEEKSKEKDEQMIMRTMQPLMEQLQREEQLRELQKQEEEGLTAESGEEGGDKPKQSQEAIDMNLLMAKSFSQSGAVVVRKSQYQQDVQGIRFEDVAGIDPIRLEVEEVVDFLTNPDKYTKRGAKIPAGVLLCGEPGVGKTLLAKAVASEAGVNFFSISASQFVEMFVGVGAARVRALYFDAMFAAPAVVFIDELDAVGRVRGGEDSGGQERDNTLNQLLVQLDGFEGKGNVITIAATNRADVLDPALVRPGRFDRIIYVPKPGVKGREQILKVHAKGKPFAKNVDYRRIATATGGMVGADLANLANIAVLQMLRDNREEVTTDDLLDAIHMEVIGYEETYKWSESKERMEALAQAATATMAANCPDFSKITLISNRPRQGDNAGNTRVKQDKMRILTGTTGLPYIFDYICIMLAPRVADELLNGGADNLSTRGALNFNIARDAARWIVMAGLTKPDQPTNDRVIIRWEDHEGTDKQVQDILDAAYQKTYEYLSRNKNLLNVLVGRLLDVKDIGHDEFTTLVRTYGSLDPPRHSLWKAREVRITAEGLEDVAANIGPEPSHRGIMSEALSA